MRTKRVRLGDVELLCNEEPGEGRAFVLVHGLTGHRDDFRTRLPELADLGWLLAPDLRGHGDFTQTGVEATFAFPQFVADLEAFLDAEGIESCDLLGHSFGGMVSLRFVLEHPARVASLILMDTSPFTPDGYSRDALEKAGEIARARGMEFLQEIVERASRANPNPSASDAATERWGGAYWPHHRLRYTAMEAAAYGPLALSMMDQTSLESRLGEISCPTSVIVGAEDVEFLRAADAFEAGIPGAVRTTIPEAGHHPHMENPAAWSAAVRAHLGRVRG
jgi:pimeloyl-ACP methyl ester carboxylesterase